MASAVDLGIDDVLDVVQNIYGIDGEAYKSSRGPQYKFLCVAHNDSDPSADVHLETGFWNCWSCSAGGDLIDLGKRATGKTRAEIKRLVAPNNPAAKAAAVSRRAKAARALLGPSEDQSERFVAHVPQDYEPGGNFRYLFDRGITKRSIRKWGVRYVVSEELTRKNGDPFTIDHAYALPIRDDGGITVGWCYRASPRSRSWFRDVRYIYTPGITDILNHTWFGLWEQWNEKHITVTEGALDAIWLTQCGFPAVAMLGNQAKQVSKIRKLMHFQTVTLFLDHDETGVGITNYLGSELTKRGVPVRVARFAAFMCKADGTPAKDANDLCPMDVELCHARALQFTTWKARNRTKAVVESFQTHRER